VRFFTSTRKQRHEANTDTPVDRHVESGYWIFCSDSEFRGECRTFGPGDYASLSGMNNVISSRRRIANDYPYDGKPDWQRDSFRQSQNYQNRR
jgi:hypothetical protein